MQGIRQQLRRRTASGAVSPDGAGQSASVRKRALGRLPRSVRISSDSSRSGAQTLTEAEFDNSMRGSASVALTANGPGLSMTGKGELANDTAALPRTAMAKEAVAKDEGRLRKILTRTISALVLMGAFLTFLYIGHVYICALVLLTQIMLFRELVSVRYNTFFHIIEDKIPMFRTTQWLWFCVAIFYAYSDFIVEVIASNTALHYLQIYAQSQSFFAFMLYSSTFVVTIATLQTGHIKFQINQLCWTIVVLCLIVGQMKYVMNNIYNGLFWFALPFLLVVTNDVFAYFSGMLCGRKFIRRPFIALSPNKTWEGFIGGGIFTIIVGWYLSRFMAQFSWLTCPTNTFSLYPEKLDCELDPIFQEASSIFNPQIFEIAPVALVKMFPGVVEVCSIMGEDNSQMTPCISGEATHSHHHFELILQNVYPVQIHTVLLGMFASLVAPFGGFLASAIKRAYGIKDFGSIFPGHGGVMDRFDCQFQMALCTWVHYNTFVKMATVSVPKLYYLYNLMQEAEQKKFLELVAGKHLDQNDF